MTTSLSAREHVNAATFLGDGEALRTAPEKAHTQSPTQAEQKCSTLSPNTRYAMKRISSPKGEAPCSVCGVESAAACLGTIATAQRNAVGRPIPMTFPNALTTGNDTNVSAPKPTMLVRSEHRTGFNAARPPERRNTV